VGGVLAGGRLAVLLEQFFRALGQHAADFAAFAFLAWDLHGVVGGRLVAHPGDDGGFGALLDGDPLRSRDGAAADGGGVGGDRGGELLGERRVGRIEPEEADDGGVEVFDVGGLDSLAALGVGGLSFRETFGGAFRFEL
jgi:hypothetical protein